jgi:hypothetical protein
VYSCPKDENTKNIGMTYLEKIIPNPYGCGKNRLMQALGFVASKNTRKDM